MNAPSRTYARRCTLALLLASVVGAVAPLAHADEVTSADGREVAMWTARTVRVPRPTPDVVARVSVCDGALAHCAAPVALQTAPAIRVSR